MQVNVNDVSMPIEKMVFFCKKCFLTKISGMFRDSICIIDDVSLTYEQLSYYAKTYYQFHADEIEKQFYKRPHSYTKETKVNPFEKMSLNHLSIEDKRKHLLYFHKKCFYYKIIGMNKGNIIIDNVLVTKEILESCAALYFQMEASDIEKNFYVNLNNYNIKYKSAIKRKKELATCKKAFEKFINLEFCSHLDIANSETFNEYFASGEEKKKYNEIQLRRYKMAFDCYIEKGPHCDDFVKLVASIGPSLSEVKGYAKKYCDLVKDPKDNLPYTVAFIKYNNSEKIKLNKECLQYIYNYCDVFDWADSFLERLAINTDKKVSTIKNLARFYQKGLEIKKEDLSFAVFHTLMKIDDEKLIKEYLQNQNYDSYNLKSRIFSFVNSLKITHKEKVELEDALKEKLKIGYSNFQILKSLYKMNNKEIYKFLLKQNINELENSIHAFANNQATSLEQQKVIIETLTNKLTIFRQEGVKASEINILKNISLIIKKIQIFLESPCFYIEDYFEDVEFKNLQKYLEQLKFYNKDLFYQLNNMVVQKRNDRLAIVKGSVLQLLSLLKTNNNFSIVDFYLQIPISLEEIKKFDFNSLNIKDFHLITQFIYKYKNDRAISKEHFIDDNYSVLLNNNPYIVTSEDKLKAIDYLELNNIPLLNSTVKLAIKHCLNKKELKF